MKESIRIMSVVGARPNFMKIAPFTRAIAEHNATAEERQVPTIDHLLVHTGQHYDERMSASFFDALSIPRPDIDLEVGSGSHAEQVGHTMIAFENALREHRPDWVVVVGDVNATCACSITAKKEHIKVAHIEAGLRSGDREMPEEINRIVTDSLSDLLFTTDALADENLTKEGVPTDRVHCVGNIMIDTLEYCREQALSRSMEHILKENMLEGRTPPTLSSEPHGLMTLHRPSNVDQPAVLGPIVHFICNEWASDMPVIWPVHPRTRKNLQTFGLWNQVVDCESLILLEPVGYLEMLFLNAHAGIMLTDSGGLQEECCVLGTPCLTLRWNTERPMTLKEHGGVSMLVGNDASKIEQAYRETKGQSRRSFRPPLWDGSAACRIVEVLIAATECTK